MADAKPKTDSKSASDPFYLDSVFPDPKNILRNIPPSIDEIAKDCVFVFDANALLTPFRVGKDSIQDIERVLKGLAGKKRLLVPAQALREYAKHRTGRITDAFDHVQGFMTKIPSKPNVTHPLLEGREEFKKLVEAQTVLGKAIDAYKDSLQEVLASIRDWHCNDPISKLYAGVFPDETIIELSTAKEKIVEDLVRRNEHEIPPGFEDDGRLGDLVIWYSILKAAEERKENLIFVSNETKIDWVHRDKANGENLFTRYELVDEYYRTSQGKHFAVVEFSRFLKLAGAKDSTVDEAKTVANEPSQELSPSTKTPVQEIFSALAPITSLVQIFIERFRNPNETLVSMNPNILEVGIINLDTAHRRFAQAYPGISRRRRINALVSDIVMRLRQIAAINRAVMEVRSAGVLVSEDRERMYHLCIELLDPVNVLRDRLQSFPPS